MQGREFSEIGLAARSCRPASKDLELGELKGTYLEGRLMGRQGQVGSDSACRRPSC